MSYLIIYRILFYPKKMQSWFFQLHYIVAWMNVWIHIKFRMYRLTIKQFFKLIFFIHLPYQIWLTEPRYDFERLKFSDSLKPTQIKMLTTLQHKLKWIDSRKWRSFLFPFCWTKTKKSFNFFYYEMNCVFQSEFNDYFYFIRCPKLL